MVGPPPDSWAVDADAAKAFEVADGIWRLRLPMPWPHISHANAYLLGGSVLASDWVLFTKKSLPAAKES